MTNLIEVPLETIEIIDSNNTKIPKDTIKAMSETANDQLIAYRDKNHDTEAKTISKQFKQSV